MRMGLTATVAGGSGYAGGELLRLLTAHPELALGAVTAASSAGRPVTSTHPHLRALDRLTFAPTTPEAVAGADVVFLALPHGASAALAARLPAQTVVVDLGADHRLADPAKWAAYYGDATPGPVWPYGLPELPGQRPLLAASRRVAGPGCYATAVTLGLAPLLGAHLVEPADVVVVAASGTSGAGRVATERLLATEVMGSISAYKVGAHQHVPEIEQALTAVAGGPVTLSFTPMLAPMPRGILATCTARLAPGADSATLREALSGAYADEPFVHVLPDGTWPTTAATVGSNAALLQVVADRHAGRAVVVVAIDNLGKGAAGQAVQCANLALGLDETAGLSAQGVAP